MIKLSELASKINDGLNDELEKIYKNTEQTSPLFSEREKYVFCVSADTANYVEPTREENIVTYPIVGVLSQLGSTIENTQNGLKTATMNTRLEIAVPAVDPEDDQGNIATVEAFRELFNAFFSSNGTGYVTEGNDTYFYGYNYSIPRSGIRQQFQKMGDGFSFFVSIDWFFIQSGLNSREIVLELGEWVDDDQEQGFSIVPYSSIGFNRSVTQEGNVVAGESADQTSDTGNGIKHMISSDMFTLNFACPTLFGPVNDMLNDYILCGEIKDIAVRVTVMNKAGDGEGNKLRRVYKMAFLEATLNGEGTLNASSTAVLGEVM